MSYTEVMIMSIRCNKLAFSPYSWLLLRKQMRPAHKIRGHRKPLPLLAECISEGKPRPPADKEGLTCLIRGGIEWECPVVSRRVPLLLSIRNTINSVVWLIEKLLKCVNEKGFKKKKELYGTYLVWLKNCVNEHIFWKKNFFNCFWHCSDLYDIFQLFG